MGTYKLCLGCMEEKGQLSVCPHCGYVEGQSHDPSHLRPGTVLNDRYLVGKAVKTDSEGILYIAYDKVIGCRVDVKEYMPKSLCERMRDSDKINVAQKDLVQYKTLMSEFTELHKKLARMRTLSHISPPLDIFACNNTTYVVFEHIEGMTFINYLKDNAGELSWDEVKKLFPPLFTTLSLIHNAGIIHRGISPETIYYTTDGELKLTGFSVAAARTQSSELKGDLYTGYAAPEQYNSSDWQGTWTDVYSVCAVLYRILTGCMPVEAVSRVVNDNLIEAHDINSNVPKNVSKAIMDGMRLLSDARTQTMTDLVTKLFAEQQMSASAASAAATTVRRAEAQTRTAVRTQPPVKTTETHTVAKKQAEAKAAPQKTTLFEQIKVPILISCLLLAVIIIIVVLFLPLVEDLGDDNSSSSASTSYSDSEVNIVDSTTTATTTVTTTTTTTSASVTPSELYTLRNLVGEEYELVATSATSRYVKFVVIEQYSDTIEKGIIIEQSVPADEAIPKGSEVELTVSMGPAVIDLPDYTNKGGYTYKDELVNLGVKEENITISEYDNDGSHQAGIVAFTSLDESGKINLEEGEAITIYIFKAAETTPPAAEAPAGDASGEDASTPADTSEPAA
ncbi:MAG: PASTA domain-containing protein [Oscillospiraceae bacterium]|nr:PASTA domain-containing protein [Oscillospiraceae bacterium]